MHQIEMFIPRTFKMHRTPDFWYSNRSVAYSGINREQSNLWRLWTIYKTYRYWESVAVYRCTNSSRCLSWSEKHLQMLSAKIKTGGIGS